VTDTETRVLSVETIEISDLKQIIPLSDPERPLLWMRKGQGLVGIGEAVRLEFEGPTRMQDAAAAWRELVDAATVTNPVELPGTGLVAFGAFAFSTSSAEKSVLIVPRIILGKRDGRFWVTKITVAGDDRPLPRLEPRAFGDEYRISLLPGDEDPGAFRADVETAIQRIVRGDVGKVVLARNLVGHLPEGSDIRRVLVDLAMGYPDCWTYSVDGLIGSSPETLVGVSNRTVSARVLAGTMSRGRDADSDAEAATSLVTSVKDNDEHAFAVQSVVAALRPHSPHLTWSELPFALKLPNLWHLATDVAGPLTDRATSLDLIAALHPTAAVAGFPTDAALALIDELEPFDRGRYAGPVGWVDAAGDGEWAIALRCAQISPTGDITAYAGCGIVAESDPMKELTETKMKFRPIVEAFG